MSHSSTIREADLRHLVPVRSLDDLAWLVKESEIMTGEPGREFVIAGADRPAYHVQFEGSGYQIRRTDRSEADHPHQATGPELRRHSLGDALMHGLVYTAGLH
jgi:hypothetical protein